MLIFIISNMRIGAAFAHKRIGAVYQRWLGLQTESCVSLFHLHHLFSDCCFHVAMINIACRSGSLALDLVLFLRLVVADVG